MVETRVVRAEVVALFGRVEAAHSGIREPGGTPDCAASTQTRFSNVWLPADVFSAIRLEGVGDEASAATLRCTRCAPPLHGLTAQVAGEFAKEITSVVRAGGWRDGPSAGLTRLTDLARDHKLQLVVVIGDTDLWSAEDAAAARNATRFFNAMRSLHTAAEAKLVLAVQDHWASGNKTAAARSAASEFNALTGLAARRLPVPTATSKEQAHKLTCAIIDRRVEISTDATRPSGERWCEALFSEDALALLGEHCRRDSPRTVLGIIRDALDRQPQPPSKLDRENLLEAL